MMWGTTSQHAELMGDSSIGFEALSTDDCRLFPFSAEKWALHLLGLLQQYRHLADMAFAARDVRCWGAGSTGRRNTGVKSLRREKAMRFLAVQFQD